MFQDHHILSQLFADHPVIKFLGSRFNKDAIRNLMALPAKQAVATDLSASPHTGGHLGTYYKGFWDYLETVEKSPRFEAALAGDTRALGEISSDVNALIDAAKYAQANGHLFANTPAGMTPEQANEANDKWFENWRKYAVDNQRQIQQMQETVEQLYNASQWDAALGWPLLSPTSDLSMAERIEILKRYPSKRYPNGFPISLQFTAADPIPALPGLVPPFVDIRLPGFLPPPLEASNQPEGFTPSNPLLTYGLSGFPVPPPDLQRPMQVPPSTAMPSEPQVLQFDEMGQPLTFLSGPSQTLGSPAAVDQVSALLTGAVALGLGALLIPGAEPAGVALLAGLAASVATKPAFAAKNSSDNKAADGGVFSAGATSYNPFDHDYSEPRSDTGQGIAPVPSLIESRELGSQATSASSFVDRFGNWTDTPAGTAPSMPSAAPGTRGTSAAETIAPEEVRRLTRMNSSNAGSVFASGTAPVPYLPAAEFSDPFGGWIIPTGDGQPSQANRPTGAFADEPSYIIPPPIFGSDDPGHPRNDAEEWFARWIQPLIRPE